MKHINDLLRDYQTLPEYSGITLTNANQVSLFGDRPINVAATRGAIEEMAVLLAHGADLNCPGEHGYTALHNAVEQGKSEAVAWLLAHGADRSIRNQAGECPSDLAEILGEDKIATLLARVGRGE
ncbi:ankyrin repeat domain-containing protein [Azonexus sp.]|jgi:ankyrin repeat protein|uniref:ankyrin repeat domain-containing protein n=1 Tax=Azonexus sp. TaxID=1872668 RepID=UPI00282AEF13|nr:ankyrin repeat domain-containing protein [Azonexus sp.]MDR1995003.1 ankyrin repeat domain-containing protein [Azonexus sp.]